MSIFAKALKEITKEDIFELRDEEYSEDHHLEFKSKRLLNGKWEEQRDIPDKAKDNIAKEIIAFANSDGGICIIGIEESRDENIVEKIDSIENPSVLAERILRSLYDRIESKIPNLKATGIETEEGSGVVIFKVEKSYQAPHRRKSDKEFFKRRNEESPKMIVREIKDLTIQSVNTFKNLQDNLDKRSKDFVFQFRERKIPFGSDLGPKDRIGIRITLMPLSDNVRFPDIHKKISDKNFNSNIRLRFDGEFDNYKMSTPFPVNRSRPILRGILIYGNKIQITVKESGLIELVMLSNYTPQGRSEPEILGDYIVGYTYKALELLDELNDLYDFSDQEFVIDIELLSDAEQNILFPVGWSLRDGYPTVNKNRINLPQYSYKGEDMNDVLNRINEDLLHITGNDKDWKFEII